MKVRKGKSSVKKRIAVFSDTHGNLTALQAMYRDSIAQHVDEYWFIGDLLMPGPSVKPIWEILQEMKPTVIVRGNWDDLVVRGARGMMDMERPSHIYFARLAQYVAEHAPDGMIDEIASWPMHVTKRVGLLNFGISHNLPWLNMGQDLFPRKLVKILISCLMSLANQLILPFMPMFTMTFCGMGVMNAWF